MKHLSDNVISNKRVLLRCDLNVTVVNGEIIDNSKIIKSLKTINYLLENNNKVIIFSHFGRVKTEEDKLNNSLRVVYEELKKYVDIDFIYNPLNLKEILNTSSKKCFLVENTRFTDIPNKRESINDLELSKYWASFGDVFVLDAFASSHRAHSSTAGISNYLPTYIGFSMEEEINNLGPLINNNIHPFIVIMGGVKVDDKIKIIEELIKKCDKLILTGGILNTFLKVFGKNIGNSLASNDEEVISSVKNIIKEYSGKLYFTDDFVIKRNDTIINGKINDIIDGDIILDNKLAIIKILNDSNIIFLNGTCGKYEEKEYETGTLNLLKDLADTYAKVYIGGGDTVSAVNKFGFTNSYTYLSSGGGATLEYIAYGKLKALEYIKENEINK